MKNDIIKIQPNTVHIWCILSPEFFEKVIQLKKLLDPLELARAERFKFKVHHDRFVVARSMLRKILNLYTHIDPHDIKFRYGDHGKPYLDNNIHPIQFNLSHSEDWVVYAITNNIEIGVDIETIQYSHKDNIAQRFFSAQENESLAQLSPLEKGQAFYQIWVKKEAVLKLLGKGLFTPLTDFSVDWRQEIEVISLHGARIWLTTQPIISSCPLAFATQVLVNNIKNFKWDNTGFHPLFD